MRADYANDRSKSGAQTFGNMVLYKMCQGDQLRHDVPEVVTGKLWLIGRAYAASPERGSGEKPPGAPDDFFEYLAGCNRSDWLALDQQLSSLTEGNEFSASSMQLILPIHRSFMDMISNAIGKRRLSPGKEPRAHRSFASKYLHFHRPDHFPIYDSYVTAALARETKGNSDIPAVPTDGVDPTYAQFCSRLAAYRQKMPTLTLRQLDQGLYDLQRKYLDEQKKKSWSSSRKSSD